MRASACVCVCRFYDSAGRNKCVHARIYECMHICMYACMHARVHVCMYMYVCMYVCMYVSQTETRIIVIKCIKTYEGTNTKKSNRKSSVQLFPDRKSLTYPDLNLIYENIHKVKTEQKFNTKT